jgi:hypothetical protein
MHHDKTSHKETIESLGRKHHDLKIRMPVKQLWGWLTDEEQAGLRTEATKQAFEAELKRSACDHLESVESFEIEFVDEGDATIEPEHLANDKIIMGAIRDIFINCEWLRYETPEQHAAGLVNNDRISPILHLQLQRVYDIDLNRAFEIVLDAEANIKPEAIKRKAFKYHAMLLRSLIVEYSNEFEADDGTLLIHTITMLDQKAAGR